MDLLEIKEKKLDSNVNNNSSLESRKRFLKAKSFLDSTLVQQRLSELYANHAGLVKTDRIIWWNKISGQDEKNNNKQQQQQTAGLVEKKNEDGKEKNTNWLVEQIQLFMKESGSDVDIAFVREETIKTLSDKALTQETMQAQLLDLYGYSDAAFSIIGRILQNKKEILKSISKAQNTSSSSGKNSSNNNNNNTTNSKVGRKDGTGKSFIEGATLTGFIGGVFGRELIFHSTYVLTQKRKVAPPPLFYRPIQGVK